MLRLVMIIEEYGAGCTGVAFRLDSFGRPLAYADCFCIMSATSSRRPLPEVTLMLQYLISCLIDVQLAGRRASEEPLGSRKP